MLIQPFHVSFLQAHFNTICQQSAPLLSPCKTIQPSDRQRQRGRRVHAATPRWLQTLQSHRGIVVPQDSGNQPRETLAFEMPAAPMPSPLLCRSKGKYVQHGKSWMDTGGTGDGRDRLDFSCSACRAGGKWNLLLKGWLKVSAGMRVGQGRHRFGTERHSG